MAKPGKKPMIRCDGGSRICTKCNQFKPLEAFSKDRRRPDGYYPFCNECNNSLRREYRRSNTEAVRAVEKKYKVKRRRSVLDHYGGKCACCGESHYEFLAIDHVNGGGLKHRKSLKHQSTCMAAWLIRNGLPEGFRVLCHNCNNARGFYGYCPHERQ